MPYLVTVSGGRVPLRRGHTYSIGRALDCDVVVEDAACSRRHAQVMIARSTDAAFLEDCGSRNGTFLNGERVRSRVAVREGSRIQVGASIFLVRLKEDQGEIELADTGTISYESGTVHQEVDGGELANYGLVDLLKLLFNSQRSVTMHVALPGEHAFVEVRGGEIRYAYYAGLEGFNALVKLGRQNCGLFWLVETEEKTEVNITEPTVRLLSELGRCLDPSHTTR